MQNTVRTTIRIRKDLLDLSRQYAIKRSTSLQNAINYTLAAGFGHVSDLDSRRQAMSKIDKFRKSFDGKKVDLKKLLKSSKKDFK
ncbi:hypothetical protein A2164_04035 [Candidatus Curtissbacteria bacterium RBG_13_35_7]|uniref:CopG family transcriptional regulator n=1 Tax=Candidatus Curtissbacteria bacterium RBG_13_35_7 TaxID=1797705 RepID=A0A1F5G5Z8_9BACT|nr:MAG: hypothetical protein A2164_04035 [Candidatus Curtissbacteria bacterium RBG_13_35_7]